MAIASALPRIHQLRLRARHRDRGWLTPLVVLALLSGIPIVVVLAHLGALGSDDVAHLVRTVLPRYVFNTLGLTLGVTLAATLLGVATAWLVTAYDFPGRRLLQWCLVLPLALPAFIAAITYSGIFDFAGPVQRLFRDGFGAAVGSYPVLRIRNFAGLMGILTLVFYPYVYITTRAAFRSQSARIVEIARSHGYSPWHAFLQAALPAARPAVVGGAALVAMETVGEFGAAHYFGVDTLSIGIFRAWFSLGSMPSALALAAVLLVVVGVLVFAERWSRRFARYEAPGLHHRPLSRTTLGSRRWLATTACALPLLLGFGVPVLQLLAWAVRTGAPTGRLGALAAASLGLAATATFFTLGLAILVAYSARLGGNRPAVGMSLHPVLTIAATSGYAVPAAVLAVGVAATFSWIDRNLIAVADATLGVSLPLLTTGTIVALVAAYVVRFFALGHNGAEAGMAQVSRRFDDVARSLGAGPGRTMLRAVLPPARPALTAAAVLLVVEVLKELPLTLILRPLNVNTLATEVFRFAGTEQVAESAVYSLIIIAIGALAVPILSARSAGN